MLSQKKQTLKRNRILKKYSKIIPMGGQTTHSLIEIKNNFNSKIKFQTRLCKLTTKHNNFPRIIKEIDIDLGNNQIITLRDVFTTFPNSINDEFYSMAKSQIIDNNCFIDNFEQEEEQIETDSQESKTINDLLINNQGNNINIGENNNKCCIFDRLKTEIPTNGECENDCSLKNTEIINNGNQNPAILDICDEKQQEEVLFERAKYPAFGISKPRIRKTATKHSIN